MDTVQMSALLKQLRKRGIYLWAEGDGKIHYSSPPQAFTPELRGQVSALRTEILHWLQRSSETVERAPEVAGAELVWRPAAMQLGMANSEGCPNVAAAASWDGALQMEAFRTALDRVLRRHSILRTRYLHDNVGGTWAVTECSVDMPVRFEDFRSFSEDSRQREALTLARSIVTEPFNVIVAPLVRVAILVLSDCTAWFLFVVHHSLFDAASRRILLSEFLTLYRAGLSGESSSLAKVPMQYSTFAREQRTLMSGARGLRAAQYWQTVFADAEPLFWLPYDRQISVPATKLKVGGKLLTPVLNDLRRIARQHYISLFLVVAAVFSILLSRWSSRSKVTFFILDSGRRSPEHIGLLGCLANAWPLCVNLTGEPTFGEALRRVHSSYIEALPHANITFEKLGTRWSGAEQDRCCPIVFLNFTPYDRAYGELGTQRIGSANFAHDAEHLTLGSTVALDLEIIESADHLFWYIRYRADLFNGATIQCVSDSLAHAFLRVTRDQYARPSDLVPYDISQKHPE